HVVLGAAVGSASSYPRSPAVDALPLPTDPETPLGRTPSESLPSCAQTPTAETTTNAQKIQLRVRDFMSGELATEILFVQASGSLEMATVTISSRARSVRSRTLPVHR